MTCTAKVSDTLIETFNCAGLATRTFDYMGVADLKQKFLSKGKMLADCTKECGKCQIKYWLWEYDLAFEVTVGGAKQTSQPNRDFHVVAGKVSCKDGSDLKNVFSKNGKRPIKGPDYGKNFRPPDREHREANTAQAPKQFWDVNTQSFTSTDTKIPVIGVRTNRTEECYCL